MNRKFFDYILLACAVLSAVLLFAAVASPRYAGDTASAARKVERRLSSRMAKLERFVGEAPRKLPSDMVIYTYVNDSLLVWQNQFPVRNDDISSRVMVQRLTNPRAGLESPLANASGTASFMNLGANWYIVKAFDEGAVRKIAGLMVVSGTDRSSYNGVNPRLGLGMRFSVKPLTFSEGSPVRLDSVPVFKILYDSLNAVVMADGTLLWLALALFLVTVVLFVLNGRSPVRALAACGGILAAVLTMYFWGRSVQSEMLAFSPMLYSGGRVFFSLGAVLLLNLAIFLCVLVLYLVRRNIWSRVRSNALAIALAVAGAAAVAALCFYLHFTIRSIILNSGISLELYKFSTLSVYSFLVYASLLTTLSCIPMILQLMQPAFSRLFGWHADMFSPAARLVFSLLAAVWLVVVSAVLGFEKEEDRMEVWAGKLAVDRDVNLELALMRVERRIAEDGVIAALSTLDGSEGMIRNRIIDNYLGPVAGNYGINVVIIRGDGRSQANTAQLRRILREGVPIATGSPFLCIDTPSGTSRYDGVFTYYDEIQGAIHVIVGITRRNYSGAKGYSRLATVFLPSRGNLPQAYSYSRYHGRNLRQFNGEYPYSTIMGDDMYRAVYEQKLCHFNDGGYVHFVTVVTEGEAVIISRRKMGIISYAIGLSFVAVLMGLLLLALRGGERRKGASRSNYFRSRVERALTVSLTLTLVAMAGASVFFVYRRNEANQQAIMSARINAVQMLVQDRVKRIMSDDLLHSSELAAMLTSVSDNTGSDITLYTTSGKMAFTTDPEVFDRMILGYRINPEALDLLLVQNSRYCILREDLLNRHFHNMYVPFTGPDGTVLGILCSPFIEENYDFERDAAMHLMAIFTVFLLMFL
ncbi:MAG: hypothetical protein IJS66_00990, partial [Bacteroidales bacterium]|nr:hypothetical protein [Bacteroidales bacterium]